MLVTIACNHKQTTVIPTTKSVASILDEKDNMADNVGKIPEESTGSVAEENTAQSENITQPSEQPTQPSQTQEPTQATTQQATTQQTTEEPTTKYRDPALNIWVRDTASEQAIINKYGSLLIYNGVENYSPILKNAFEILGEQAFDKYVNGEITVSLLGAPKKYKGIFINDMRMSVPQRHKGVGTKVINKILRSDKTYMLDPVEDGKTFWKKFGFKEKEKVSVREKIE